MMIDETNEMPPRGKIRDMAFDVAFRFIGDAIAGGRQAWGVNDLFERRTEIEGLIAQRMIEQGFARYILDTRMTGAVRSGIDECHKYMMRLQEATRVFLPTLARLDETITICKHGIEQMPKRGAYDDCFIEPGTNG